MVYLFDENIPYKFVEGLALIDAANHKADPKTVITHIKLLGKEGITDEDVIELAGSMNATILTFDKDFRHIKSYYPLYKKHNVGVVFFKTTKHDAGYWGTVKLIMNNWEALKEKLKDVVKPFAIQVERKGISKFDF